MKYIPSNLHCSVVPRSGIFLSEKYVGPGQRDCRRRLATRDHISAAAKTTALTWPTELNLYTTLLFSLSCRSWRRSARPDVTPLDQASCWRHSVVEPNQVLSGVPSPRTKNLPPTLRTQTPPPRPPNSPFPTLPTTRGAHGLGQTAVGWWPLEVSEWQAVVVGWRRDTWTYHAVISRHIMTCSLSRRRPRMPRPALLCRP